MKIINVGITGQDGFIGSHLYNNLSLFPKKFRLIDFERSDFEKKLSLDNFVLKCDVIVHLAALNRHKNQSVIYRTNLDLSSKLIDSLNRTKCTPHIIMSSSSQEEKDNAYGKSKRLSRALFEKWAKEKRALFTGMIIPNVFGPFGKPNYNSVVATFCDQLCNGKVPIIKVDVQLKLIYIGELIKLIIDIIIEKNNKYKYEVKNTYEAKVSELLKLLKSFQISYIESGEIPPLKNNFDLNLFNTLRSYIDIKKYFPKKYIQNNDSRGSFVELVRLGIGGQVSFSTTLPGVTRGNHFHTRKIERFSVIRGKALIQLRQIGKKEITNLFLNGDEPSYVDMPVWYTHNIKNIGEEVLYTNFWINEPYDHENPDTYFENV